MNTEPLTPNSQAATSDTSPLALSQVAVVGAVTMTLAGVSLLVTLVLVLSLWMPTWVATLATTLLLTATSLAVFASGMPGSRLRGTPVSRGYVTFPVAPVGAFPVAPVSDGGRPAPIVEPVFQESGVHQNPVYASEPVQAIEVAEFEDSLPENDDQETTVVRHVDRLMHPAERTGFGQHVGLGQRLPVGQRTTRPMFQKTTQPSMGR